MNTTHPPKSKIDNLRRAASFFTALVIAFPHTLPLSAQASSLPQTGQRVSTAEVKIPEDSGIVRRSSRRVDSPTKQGQSPVILIEDAHAVRDAQLSIGNILAALEKSHGLSFVGVEGAAGELDAALFKAFPGQAILEKVLDDYLYAGEMTAAVSSAIRLTSGARYHGVEAARLYESNIDAYLSGSARQKRTLEKLSDIEKRLLAFKKENYSSELLDLDEKSTNWFEKHDLMGMLSHVAESRRVKENGILSSYPHLAGLLAYLPPGNGHAPSAGTEIRALAAKLGSGFKAQEAAEFNFRLQEYETEQMEEMEFLRYLRDKAKQKSVPFEMPAEIEARLRIFERVRSSNGEQILSELESLVGRLKEELLTTSATRAADRLSRSLYLLKKLARFELVRKEWTEIKVRTPGELDYPAALEQTRQELETYFSPEEEAILPFYRFYEAAEKREAAMLEQLRKNTGAESRGLTVLIAGGFHTEGLSSLLEEKGIPWMIVTPRIGGLAGSEKYQSQMTGDVPWKKHFNPEGGRISVSGAFQQDLSGRLYASLKEEAGESGTRIQLKKWRDNVIVDLAGRGQLASAGNYTRIIDNLLLGTLEGGTREDLEARWSRLVDEFSGKIQQLDKSGKLTPENLFRPFEKPAAAAWTTSMVLTKDTVPEHWASGTAAYEAGPKARRTARRKSRLPDIGQIPRIKSPLPEAESIGPAVRAAALLLSGASGAGSLLPGFISQSFRSELRESVPALEPPSDPPELPNLRFTMNLKDIGAYVTSEGKLDYRDSLTNATRLLPLLKEKGVGRVYLYNGLFEMSVTGRDVHRGRNIDKIKAGLLKQGETNAGFAQNEAVRIANGGAFVWSGDGRAVSYVDGYATKETSLIDPKTGKAIEVTDDYNPFSILSLLRLNPKLSASPDDAGSEEKTRELLKSFIQKAHELGIRTTLDFIPWLSPDSIDETNYRWTFHLEVSEEQNEEFRRRDEEGKRAYMQEIAAWDKRWFPVRIKEEAAGRDMERIVRVQHLISDYGDSPNIDQVILNPHLEEVQNYYVEAFSQLISLEADEVRVDLAHYYLNQFIKDHPQNYMGLQTDGKPEPWALIIARAKKIAADYYKAKDGSEGTIEINTEAYDQYVSPLLENGVDRSYHDDFFKTLVEVARGAPASHLSAQIAHLLGNKGKLTAFLSNYDHFRLEQLGGAKSAAQAIIFLLAYAGVDVIWDMNDWLGLSGHLFPMVGGNADPNNPDHHPFANEQGLEILTRFGRLKAALKDAPADAVRRNLFSGAGGKKETWIQQVPNGREDKFISWAWRTGDKEWYLLVADMKPWAGEGPGWVHLPRKALNDALNDPERGAVKFSAADVLTGQEVKVNHEHHHVEGLVIDPSRQFTVLRITRSELRAESEGLRWGQGKAAGFALDRIDYQPADAEMIDPLIEDIRGKVAALKPKSPRRPLAMGIFLHLERLREEAKINEFDERRWTSESFFAAQALPDELRIGRGAYADSRLASEMLFRLAAQSYAQSTDVPAEELTKIYTQLFGRPSAFTARYDKFIHLTDDVFLKDAVNRFNDFAPRQPLFHTRDLFQDWLDWEIHWAGQGDVEAPHPAIAQAGFLGNLVMKKGWNKLPPAGAAPEKNIAGSPHQFKAFFEILYPLYAFTAYQVYFITQMSYINEAEEALLFNQLKYYYKMFDISGTTPRHSGLVLVDVDELRRANDAHRIFSEALPNRAETIMKEEKAKAHASRLSPTALEIHVIEKAMPRLLEEIRANRWYRPTVQPLFPLEASMPRPLGEEPFDTTARVYGENIAKAFYAPTAWQNALAAKLPRFGDLGDGRVNIPVPGFETQLTFASMLQSTGTASGYVWKDHYPYSHQEESGNIPWIGFFTIDPSLTDDRGGITQRAADGSAFHLLIDSNRMLQYYLQKKKQKEQFTIVRDKKGVWSALLGWFHNTGDNTDTNRAMHFLVGLRAALSPKTTEPSPFTPGGVDVVEWSGEIIKLAAKADYAYWDSARTLTGSIEKFLNREQTSDETRLFIWLYSLYTHPDGLFAYLAENLRLEPGTQRLTRESALLILDAVTALNWAGLPTMDKDKLRISKFLIRELLEYFKMHPDGISVPNDVGLRNFLTHFGANKPTIAGYESWMRMLALERLEKGVIDIENARLIHEEENIPELTADSASAYVMEDKESNFEPEGFPAADLLNPKAWPWAGVPERMAIWKGTYRDGLPLPRGRVKYVFPGIPNGTEITVFVRSKTVAFEVTLPGGAKKEIAKISFNEARSQELASGPNDPSGRPAWKKIYYFERMEIQPLPELLDFSEKTKTVMYLAEAGADGFLLVKGSVRHLPFFFPQLAGAAERTLYIEYNGVSLTVYDSRGERFGFVNAALSLRSSDSPRIEIRPVPSLPVDGPVPSTLVENSDLYTLTSKLEPLMRPASAITNSGGKGYERIHITPMDEPNIGTDGKTVIVSRYYLKHPEQAEKDFREFLEKTDPVYELRAALKQLSEMEKSPEIFAPNFTVPARPEAVTPDDSWLNGSADAYASMHLEAERTVRRITILGKFDRFRRAHLNRLGDWSREDFFRQGLKDLLVRNPDPETLNSFFFRAKGFSTVEIQKTIEDEATYKERAAKDRRPFNYFSGMGIARSGHFLIVDGQLVFNRSFRKDMTPYIFLRFTDGTVRTFDFETGDLVDEKERAHRQALADYQAQRQALVDAMDALVKRDSSLDLNAFEHALEEFLAAVKHPDEIQNLTLKISLLGSLTQLLPSVVRSQQQEINTAVVRLLLDFIIRDGHEKAEQRARSLVDTYRGPRTEELGFYLYFAFVENDKAFQVSPENEGDDYTERFRNFFDNVFLPATRLFSDTLHYLDLTQAENYYAEIMRLIIESQDNLRERITAHVEAKAEQAGRRGIISLKIGFIEQMEKDLLRKLNSLELYFINKIFEEKAEEQKQISDDEVKERATVITPYGGVEGIGASAALIEYRGEGQEETDSFILDAGVRLDENLSGPNFPKSIEDFPSRPKAIVITHAHLDHIGWLIPLWRDVLKKSVPIYVTEGTHGLMQLVLNFMAAADDDAAGLRGGGTAAFTRAEVEEIMKHVRPLPAGKWFALSPKLKFKFHGPVGHLHGAASVVVSTPDSTAFLTGDVSSKAQGPVPGFERLDEETAANIDTVMRESTYGVDDRFDEEAQEKLLANVTVTTIARGGRVVIPAFANGRSQRVFLLLLQSFERILQAATKDVNREDGRVTPDLKIYIDGQAAVFTRFYLNAYPEVFGKYRDIIRDHVVIIDSDDFRVRGRLRSEAAERENNQHTIVIASSGNATYGRSRYWASRVINDKKSTLIFTGYMDPQESGSRMLRAVSAKKTHFNFGDDYGVLPLLADIREIKVAGHSSGPEIVRDILEPSQTSIRALLLGHGSPSRLREVLSWTTKNHPEWKPVIMRENQKYLGAVLRTEAGLETRRRFFESRIAEPLFETRSEIRTARPEVLDESSVYSGVLETLARGVFSETNPAGAGLIALVRREGSEKVAEELRAAAGNPYYLNILAGIEDGSAVEALQAERNAEAAHPGLALKHGSLTDSLIGGLESRVRGYFAANPGGTFRYSLAFPTADSGELRARILVLARTLRKLREDPVFGQRITASVQVLVTADEMGNPALKEYYRELMTARTAKIVEISDVDRAAVLLNGFMEKNSNALVYGAEGFPVAAAFSGRLVRSGVSEEYAFPVALVLAERLAREPGKITAELLRRVTDNISEIVRFDGTGLYITTLALELSVRFNADQLLTSSA